MLEERIKYLEDSRDWWKNKYDKEHKEFKELKYNVNKALNYIKEVWEHTNMPTNTIVALRTIEHILGSDKEC